MSSTTSEPPDSNDSEILVLDPRGNLELRVGSANGSSPAKAFRVCSRSLARISPVFDRMLYGNFAESKAKNSRKWVVDLPEDNPGPLGLLLNIAHSRFDQIPHELSITSLYEVAVAGHYYDATQILMPWADRWVLQAEQSIGNVHHRLLRTLWIAWEFGRIELFEETARRLVMEAPGTVFAPDAPWADLQMPPDIVERISAIRLQTLQSLLSTVREITDRLVVVDERPRWCPHASYMGHHRCLWPVPEADEIDHLSIIQLQSTLMNLVVHDIGEEAGVDHRACNPRDFIEGEVRRILAEIPDPVLDSHRKFTKEQIVKLTI